MILMKLCGNEHFFSETRRQDRQVEVFRDALDFCELRDFGFSGVPSTYDNRKDGLRDVEVRLNQGDSFDFSLF
jgi:hypothetical protein